MNDSGLWYFGCGANADPSMIEALVGRIPDGIPATLPGYGLYIQTWNEIPKEVQEKLQPAWNERFRTYFIASTENDNVRGTLWRVTAAELRIIEAVWEFWYQPVSVTVTADDGRRLPARTETLPKTSAHTRVNGRDYEPFLNDKETMLAIARGVVSRAITWQRVAESRKILDNGYRIAGSFALYTTSNTKHSFTSRAQSSGVV